MEVLPFLFSASTRPLFTGNLISKLQSEDEVKDRVTFIYGEDRKLLSEWWKGLEKRKITTLFHCPFNLYQVWRRQPDLY